MSAAMREQIDARAATTCAWVGVPTQFGYDSANPFAVSLTVAGVPWVLARDLLRDALHHPAGIGDVRLWPCPPVAVFLQLRSPAGEALLELDYRQVAGFVARTAALVPFGSEVMDLGGLDRLIGGGA